MQVNYSIGDKVRFVASNAKGLTVECVAEIVEYDNDNPYAQLIDPLDAFTSPPSFVMFPSFIYMRDEELHYKGEMDGCVLIPGFLWK